MRLIYKILILVNLLILLNSCSTSPVWGDQFGIYGTSEDSLADENLLLLSLLGGSTTSEDEAIVYYSQTAVGLTWKTCPENNAGTDDTTCSGGTSNYLLCSTTNNGPDCGNQASGATSGPAYDICESLNTAPYAGKTGWRVPTETELSNFRTFYLTDTSVWPNNGTGEYWTSTISDSGICGGTQCGKTLQFSTGTIFFPVYVSWQTCSLYNQ